jgi:hypothetical protein
MSGTTITSSETVSKVTPVPNSEGDPTVANNPNTSTTKESANISKDIMHNVTNLPSLAPDWTYRRKAIFMSLYFSGGVFGLMATTICAGLLLSYFRASLGPIDQGLIAIAETIIYTIGFFASGVIGTFCFGAAFEIGAYRKNMTSLVTNIATAGSNTNVTTTPAPPPST